MKVLIFAAGPSILAWLTVFVIKVITVAFVFRICVAHDDQIEKLDGE